MRHGVICWHCFLTCFSLALIREILFFCIFCSQNPENLMFCLSFIFKKLRCKEALQQIIFLTEVSEECKEPIHNGNNTYISQFINVNSHASIYCLCSICPLSLHNKQPDVTVFLHICDVMVSVVGRKWLG